MQRQDAIHALADKLSRDLTDRGKIIEAGWMSLKTLSVPCDAPQMQIDEMRNAFFAGAQHLFSSIMTILDPGAEPTDKDLERMSLIEGELADFYKQFLKRHMPTKGNA